MGKPNNRSSLEAKHLRELEALYEISRAMQNLDLDKVLHQILEGVTRTVGFDRARLYVLNQKERKLELKMAVGLKKEPIADLTLPLDRNNSMAARAVLEKKPFVVYDAQRDPRVNRAIIQLFNTKSFAAVPLITRNRKVKGVIAADNLYSGKAIDEESLKRLVTFSNQAAVAMDNAESHAQVKKFNQQLSKRVEQAKKDLLNTQAQLIQSEKLAALGELSAGIAHEIRNPLTSIGLIAHSLSSRLSSQSAETQEEFRLMQSEIARLNNIVTQFLEYAKPSPPKFQKVHAKEVFSDIKALLMPKFQARGLAWKEEWENGLPPVKADKHQLQQVFINLALNALGAMQEKGSAFCVRGRLDGNFVRIECTDDGPGIRKKDLQKLFVPFFTTKETGLGLGLSISQRIIAAHKGSIEASSIFGRGACFTARLPV